MTGMWQADDRRTIGFNLAMYEHTATSERCQESLVLTQATTCSGNFRGCRHPLSSPRASASRTQNCEHGEEQKSGSLARTVRM